MCGLSMTKHLQSKWRDPRIQPFPLNKLTPMDLHKDNRWKTRDLPRIEKDGLWYPIMLFKVTPDWWINKHTNCQTESVHRIDAVINEDGMVWAIKMGSNRYQCAIHLGYNTIDAIMFDDVNDCVKLAVWYRECDPLNNNDAIPYKGTFSY